MYRTAAPFSTTVDRVLITKYFQRCGIFLCNTKVLVYVATVKWQNELHSLYVFFVY